MANAIIRQKYDKFLETKIRSHVAVGINSDSINVDMLFPHQAVITRWAARKGRAAIFADTGLGKTRMQLKWADSIHRETGSDVLILAPLAVAQQTADEGAAIGVPVTHARDGSQVTDGINITNYDRLHRFDASRFGAVVLDESSIIKHHDAKTLGILIETFRHTPYRLCATATPAPNDWTELGTHAEFLGVCSRQEMLSEFFVHDGGDTQVWRLKGHARAEFWRWVAGWGAMLRSPADLGFDDSAYLLPPLKVDQITVESDADVAFGELFAREAQTLSERRQARRDSMRHRVSACADLANSIVEPWVIWCELNAEGDALCAAIPDAVEIRGADSAEHKERALADFASGKIRVLVTKPSIAGFGLNWQHCRRIGFVGVTDSWEAYYQAIRRCWRFGQTQPVHAYLFVSDQEGSVRANLERKERDAERMFAELSAETADAMRDEVLGQSRQSNRYNPSADLRFPAFLMTRRAA
jgi:superfamily II DNA or RNA helicase